MLAVTGKGTLFVIFTLDGVEYALDISCVQEIMRLPEITPLPASANYVIGIIDLRGSIVPILDIKMRLFGSAAILHDDTRVIVVEIAGRYAGFIVDEVAEVINISYEQVIEGDTRGNCYYSEYILGVARLGTRLLILLNPQAILEKDNQTGGVINNDTVSDN